MPAVQSVLIVGGGSAGCATATQLARAGVRVEIAEARSAVPVEGSGITLQGNALRVLRDVGVWDRLQAHGYAFDSVGMRAPDPAGTLVAEIPDVRTGGDDLPATLGIPRPTLARILLEHAAEAGADVRFGTFPTRLRQDDDGVDVTFGDGSERRYDLVVGADGVGSWTRRALRIDSEPRGTGMGIWRVDVARPADVFRTDLTHGGRCYIAGYCPTGPDTMYAYLVEDVQDRRHLSPAEQIAVVRDLASSYHGPWDDVRAQLTDTTGVNYSLFEWHVVDGPWHRGRVVLAGDAAHSCPPTLAQGAAQALEDAAVLSELLVGADRFDADLLARYTARRLPRARQVVEASVQIVQWMLDGVRPPVADVPALMHRIQTMVREPA
ncbi:FAD-dependent monooxygenase [Isoptericola sp. NEAU-Y5]|uniref:FAD-dependent monooxygenase n=1 Tax=Isoptericola luteus TaxID=2879484 RepID=A0ABS7ZGM5_9MICO|nr:FAD-dependent monooxygenase [Isoptericola sp. NEAU-Y5]MCA5894179.1 FAD-dependent monooxygenase [Isoptericola sp. NEAU-Y5]